MHHSETIQTQKEPANSAGYLCTVFLLLGSIFAFLAVALGAFGAHALSTVLDKDALDVYKTAVRYQMYHAIALLVLGSIGKARLTENTIRWAGLCLTTGIVLFSGSLYSYLAFHISWLVYLTPLGGICFLVGWLWMIVGLVRTLMKRAFV